MPRPHLGEIRQSCIGAGPVVMVTGARQVGKTTFVRHLSEPERGYVSLDDPLVLDLARSDPALLFERYPPPVLVDEIQYAPELLPYVKMHVDASGKLGQFWITGSQQFHLMKGVSESLAGRVAILPLMGFSRREAHGEGPDVRPFLPNVSDSGGQGIGLRDLYSLIRRGSLPALIVRPETDRDLFFSSHVQTYLHRDVRDLARVRDQMALLRLLRASYSTP